MLKRYVKLLLGTSHESASEAEKVKGQRFEMLSVMCVAGAVIMLWVLPDYPVPLAFLCAALVAAAIILFYRAAAHSYRAAVLEEESASEVLYRVTLPRIEILKSTEMPNDLLNALRKLAGRPAMSRDEFYSTLVYTLDLGMARVDEFKATIFKYTRVYEAPEEETQSP